MAVTLLDVRLSPPPVRRLLSGEFDERLSNIDDETALWEANEETLKAADELFEALDELPGVGETQSVQAAIKEAASLTRSMTP